jgi:hypothetical protein
VFKVIKEDITFVDSRKSRLKGDRYLRNVMTVSGGKIVYNPYGLGLKCWNEIPEDDHFRKNSSGRTR